MLQANHHQPLKWNDSIAIAIVFQLILQKESKINPNMNIIFIEMRIIHSTYAFEKDTLELIKNGTHYIQTPPVIIYSGQNEYKYKLVFTVESFLNIPGKLKYNYDKLPIKLRKRWMNVYILLYRQHVPKEIICTILNKLGDLEMEFHEAVLSNIKYKSKPISVSIIGFLRVCQLFNSFSVKKYYRQIICSIDTNMPITVDIYDSKQDKIYVPLDRLRCKTILRMCAEKQSIRLEQCLVVDDQNLHYPVDFDLSD